IPITRLAERGDLGGESKEAPQIQIESEDACKMHDGTPKALGKKAGGRRARAKSFVSSIRARFDGSHGSEHEATLSSGSPSSRMSLKTMFSSPVLAGSERLSSSSSSNQLSESKYPTPSPSEDEGGNGGIVASGIAAVLGGLPISSVPNPDDLVAANVSPNHAAAHVPKVSRSPLVATLTKANDQLESAKRELVDFSKGASKPNDKEWPLLQRLQHTIASASATLEKVSRLTRVDAANPSFIMFPPALVAYQLTRIEASLFHGIPPEALLSHSHRTPHLRIVASTDFFNYLTRIIELSILDANDPEERATTIKFWIKVASSLESLHNFQTLQAVISALATPPILRLKRTWRQLSKRSLAALQSSRRLMSEENNYYNYRRRLTALTADSSYMLSQPAIPYLGVFIMDMTYLTALNKRPSASPQDQTSCAGRISRLLEAFRCCLAFPNYPALPPSRFLKRHAKSSSMTSFTLPFARTSIEHNSATVNLMAFLGEDAFVCVDLGELKNKSPKDSDLVHNLQVVITHFILSRCWAPERAVDAKSQQLETKPSHEVMDSSLSEPSPGMLSPSWAVSPTLSLNSSSEGCLERDTSPPEFESLSPSIATPNPPAPVKKQVADLN
ncbi:hypothetical protein L0F63_002304, partial [Massospora cicadina]